MTKLEEFFVGAEREFGMDKNHEALRQVTSIPSGFSSSCWHNNEYPSLSYDGKNGTKNGDYINCDIYVGSANARLRPSRSYPFAIEIDGGGEGYIFEYLSDSWQEILDHAEKAKEILNELIRISNEKDMATAFQETRKMAKDAGFSFM